MSFAGREPAPLSSRNRQHMLRAERHPATTSAGGWQVPPKTTRGTSRWGLMSQAVRRVEMYILEYATREDLQAIRRADCSRARRLLSMGPEYRRALTTAGV